MNATLLPARVFSIAAETAEHAPAKPALRIHNLAADQLVSLPLPRGGRIECLSGCLWLTAGNGSGDIILEKGETRIFERGSIILVESLDNARFQVAPLAI